MATLEASLLASEIVRILGVSSLQEAVTNTLAAREHWNLPDRFVVLDDHQDGGVILRDTRTDLRTGQNKVYNSAWEAIPRRPSSPTPDGVRQQGLSGETDGAGKSRPGMLQVIRLCYDAPRGRVNPAGELQTAALIGTSLLPLLR